MPPAKRSTSRANERSVRQRPASSNARAMAKATAKPQDAPSEPAPVCATTSHHRGACCQVPGSSANASTPEHPEHPEMPALQRWRCGPATVDRHSPGVLESGASGIQISPRVSDGVIMEKASRDAG